MHNVLSRRELIVLGYLSKSPRSFKHINVYTTSQKVILKCTFHSETKTEKWLLIFFSICRTRHWLLAPIILKTTTNDHSSDRSGSPGFADAIQIHGTVTYEALSFLFLYRRPDWEKSNREIILWCSDTNPHEIQLFLSCRGYILKKSCLWQKSVLDTKQ